jgi:predicted dehydrogenase
MNSGSEVLGVAVVGTGAAAAQHAQALAGAPGLELRLICEPAGVPREEIPWWSGAHPVTSTVDAAFASHIDIVAICTPPGTHAALAAQILRARKAVVLEKPPVLGEAEFDALLKERETMSRPVAVMYQHRFVLADEVRAVRWSGRASAFVEVCRPRPLSYFEKAAWRSVPALAGGGTVAHLASHYLDLAFQLLGEPVLVEGTVGVDFHFGIDTRFAGAIRCSSGALLSVACTASVEERHERLTIRDNATTLEIENGRLRMVTPSTVLDLPPRNKAVLRRAVYLEVAEAVRCGGLILPISDVTYARGTVRVIERVRALIAGAGSIGDPFVPAECWAWPERLP